MKIFFYMRRNDHNMSRASWEIRESERKGNRFLTLQVSSCSKSERFIPDRRLVVGSIPTCPECRLAAILPSLRSSPECR